MMLLPCHCTIPFWCGAPYAESSYPEAAWLQKDYNGTSPVPNRPFNAILFNSKRRANLLLRATLQQNMDERVCQEAKRFVGSGILHRLWSRWLSRWQPGTDSPCRNGFQSASSLAEFGVIASPFLYALSANLRSSATGTRAPRGRSTLTATGTAPFATPAGPPAAAVQPACRLAR